MEKAEEMRRFSTFAGRIIVAFVVTSILVGVFSYQFLTKPLFEDPNSPLNTVFRTPSQPELWRHAVLWAFPVQAFRAFLYAAILFPFCHTLAGWSFARRFAAISGLFVVLSVFAGDGGTLESLYMARPELVTPSMLARTLPEPVVRGLVFSAWVAQWAIRDTETWGDHPTKA
jgi:hypothetical protein